MDEHTKASGSGGFDVTVGGHTQLNGAVIGSTAEADKNRLDTGTLGFSDIRNSAEYEVEHQSVGVSSGGGMTGAGGQFAGNMASSLLVGMNSSGSDSSTTKSAVSDGTIVIRDKDNQKQNVDDLSRDAEHANQTLSPIFDKEKEQNRLKEAQLIGEIGNQAADIARTQGQIVAAKAAADKMKDVTPQQLQAAQDEWSKANPGKTPTAEDISGQAYQNFFNEAFTNSGFGTGGKVQQAIQAATAAVQGLAGGDIGKALAGGSAPYLATVVKNTVGEDNPAALMAHAAINAALALAKGENAAAGAAGAAVGEAMGMIAKSYYDKPVSELSETEKQTVSALATLAAGLAGGLAGGSTADAVAGAQAGKTTVENNSLSGDKARETVKQAAESLKNQVRDKLGQGTTSSIANGIINALADTGDAALGSADYAADAAMALAACAAGDSYCGTALNDLSGKNQAVADNVKALMNSDTWSAVADTIKQASEGNQVALEATGGMLAGIILPGKKIPDAANRIETILKTEKNWESARNKALNIVGSLGVDSKPVIGRLEVSAGNGKVIGRQSGDGKVGWRVDYDPEKGTHINIWDYSQGKGPGKAVKQVIPFEGNEKSFETILKQLNR
ncbi:VENN motif pre-toxin domain-containing protein [Pantoea sp. BIGb0393]|nr:VENN motif pre-toxin domain-containing protein [Pantoea nemavictus]